MLVLACGGFLAYRAIAAIADAYRWTGEAEAATLARGFARSLSPRDLDDPARLRARAVRLSGVHPDLDRGHDPRPSTPDSPHKARYVQHGQRSEARSSPLARRPRPRRRRAAPALHARRARRGVRGGPPRGRCSPAVGAALLLIIGIGGADVAASSSAPSSELSHSAAMARRRRQARARRSAGAARDAVGVLAGSLDALGGTMRALQARIDGLVLKDPLTGTP